MRTFLQLVSAVLLLATINCVQSIGQESSPRIKRQALADRLGNAASGAISGFSNNPNAAGPLRGPSINAAAANRLKNPRLPSASLTAPSASVATPDEEPASLADTNLAPEVGGSSGDVRPARPSRVPPSSSSSSSNDDQQQQPPPPQQPSLDDNETAKPPPRRRQPNRRQPANKPPASTSYASASVSGDDDEDEADYYHGRGSDYNSYDSDGDDYGGVMHHMHNPIRQMTGMFSRIFDNMPTGLMDYQEDQDGNVAMASSYSSGDGYSRSRSTVTNNGRMRGVMSETRNGRTRTRRIGGGEGDDYY